MSEELLVPVEKEYEKESEKKSQEEKLLKKSADSSFYKYLREINKFAILTEEEEKEYSKRFAETGDKEAARMLIQSHLRLVVKMAGRFKNYGLPMTDLVAEGNLGLIHAVKKFDPSKGFRLSTYAMWWIRAYIQEYILRSWSMVKIGTTLAQKKLFFNLHKIKRRIGALGGDAIDGSRNSALQDEQIQRIANELNVSQKDVVDMDSRLTQGDTSLNKLIGEDDGDGQEMVEFIAASGPSQEDIAIENQEKLRQESLFRKAFEKLNEREKDILMRRQMTENALTLEELSQIYKVSRERIRQIEENAINKIRKWIQEDFDSVN